MIRKLTVLAVVLIAVHILPTDALAGRKVRLIYEAPLATEGGPAVAVTFENAREEKKGGEELPLIAQERGQYGIPSGIFSGQKKTDHADVVVPSWAKDVLRAAGYDARVGEDAALPRLHVKLTHLWGDGLGPRLQFSMYAVLQLFEVGGTEPAWEAALMADGGVTTIVQFHDPYELGFSRVFEQGAKKLLGLIATDEFQAALPGGDLEAAAKAGELLGDRDATVAAEQSAKPEQGSDDYVAKQQAQPKGFQTWDPDVYLWSGQKETIGSYVLAGIGAGLFIAGDQLNRVWAEDDAHQTGLPQVGASFVTARHIPNYDNGLPTEEEAAWVVKSYITESAFVFGIQGFVPSLGAAIPTHIAAATGADLQTVKAVLGISSLPAFLPAGIANLARFGQLYQPEWAIQQQSDDLVRIYHVVPGVISLAAGIADIAVGSVQFVAGLLYASGAIQASPHEQGLLPMPQMDEGRMSNTSANFYLAPTTDGGMAFGIYGTF